MFRLVLLVLISLSLQPCRLVWSQTHVPEVAEIVQSLKIKTPLKPKSLDRSWSSKGISVEHGVNQVLDNAASIDLEVPFDFNSAFLTIDAQLILNRLGLALNAPELRGQHFKLTGHTDAVGTEAYNLELSKRRAISVQEYLEQKMNIKPDRLEIDGKGYSQLFDPSHPTSAINRRVQVLNLGS
jgi:outer membrane protein OmpA-like peptidoglycan-associated protein